MDRGAWEATVPKGHEESGATERLSTFSPVLSSPLCVTVLEAAPMKAPLWGWSQPPRERFSGIPYWWGKLGAFFEGTTLFWPPASLEHVPHPPSAFPLGRIFVALTTGGR